MENDENTVENNIKIVEQEFRKHKYQLKEEDKKNLKIQLNRKPHLLYLESIQWFFDHGNDINFKNIEYFIKENIKLRVEMWKFFTSFEELVITVFINHEITNNENNLTYKKWRDKWRNPTNKNETYKQLNNDYEKIRSLRNLVSHQLYPLLEFKESELIDKIVALKKIDLIDSKRIDYLLEKIKSCFEEFK